MKNGEVKGSRLDEMVQRILTPWIAFGQADSWSAVNYQHFSLADQHTNNGYTYTNAHEDHRQADTADLVRRVAEQSHVLLKNDGVLPLKNVRRIAVFGQDADYPTTVAGCGGDLFCIEGSGRRHWNGTVTIGGGSGAGYGTYIVSSRA